MSEPAFRSRLAGLLGDYAAAMRAAGHPFDNPLGLSRLDRLMADEFPELGTVTREVAERWCSHCREGVHCNTSIVTVGYSLFP